MKNSQELIYETIIDGRVIRGTYSEIQQAIQDYRENR